MNMNGSAAKRLRDAIDGERIVVMPGVFDGLSARLVRDCGFESAFISGAGISESRLGVPDLGYMGFEENIAAVRSIIDCSGLACIADADTGYGNAANVFRTVGWFEAAGAGGVMIEDQVWPKRCGHMNGKEVIPAREMVNKVRAACDARRNPDTVIMARTDSFGPLGLDDAIDRLNSYRDAGADLLFADALLTAKDIGAAVSRVRGPLCVNMGFGLISRPTTELLSVRQLDEMGVCLAIFPRLLTASAVMGMEGALKAFEQSMDKSAVEERKELLVTQSRLFQILGLDDYEVLQKKYADSAN